MLFIPINESASRLFDSTDLVCKFTDSEKIFLYFPIPGFLQDGAFAVSLSPAKDGETKLLRRALEAIVLEGDIVKQ